MEEQLHKWLNQETTPEEEEALKKDAAFKEAQRLAIAIAHLETPQFNQEEAWAKLKAEKSKAKIKNLGMKNNRIWIAVAAAIALLLIAFQSGLFSTQSVEETLVMEKRDIGLPDGSFVSLNAGSKIRYNKKTFKDKRVLYLEGEGHFVVKRGGAFLVKSQQGKVRVLGTTFNVYSRKDDFQVSCYIGKVEVIKKDQKQILSSGEKARWKNNAFLKEAEYKGSPSWTVGESIFYEDPLEKVVEELGRQYGLEMTLEVKSDFYYVGGFQHDNLQAAMDNITQPFNLRYKQNGRRMRIWEE